MRVLHAATELFPYVKVGGLGDVMGALPPALREAGADARLLLPAYPVMLKGIPALECVRVLPDLLGQGELRLLRGKTDQGVPIYLADHPLFNRPGGPYEEQGDSALKFGAFSWLAAQVGLEGEGRNWRPDILHLHDWQTGLAPVHVRLAGAQDLKTVLTVHNLAYQGIYAPDELPVVGLPPSVFHMFGVEFHGDLSFLKAGLQHADRLTTVSPTYAREIQTPAFGERLEGLLAHRSGDLVGILNGVDKGHWSPSTAPGLAIHYGPAHLSGKKICKNALQREAGLDEQADAPLFSVVSRLTQQKGLDLLLACVGGLVAKGAQLMVLGTGEADLEAGFRAAARKHAGRVAVHLAYDEALSRRVFAGADALVVPSRFEPCGLTQLYALAFGTLPVVRRTGGLADTVRDLERGEDATGVVFDQAVPKALGEALDRTVQLYREWPRRWSDVMRRGMKQDFGWKPSAAQYLEVYRALRSA